MKSLLFILLWLVTGCQITRVGMESAPREGRAINEITGMPEKRDGFTGIELRIGKFR